VRLVLDTNIVVSAFLWNGAPAKLLQAVVAANVELYSSDRLFKELESTLQKEKLASKIYATGLPPYQWVSRYKGLCLLIEPAPLRPIAPDPDDDWVIATAVAAEADLIVTGDKAFLRVGRVGAVRIVTVTEALELAANLL
jgi:uncharacterized protein